MKSFTKKLIVLVTVFVLIVSTFIPVDIIMAYQKKYVISEENILIAPNMSHGIKMFEVTNEEYQEVPSGKVKWSSSNRAVATVNNEGAISAKKVGRTYIVAKIGKQKYSCKVTVKKMKHIKITADNKVTFSGEISKVNTTHAGNGQKMVCYILRLDTPLIASYDDGNNIDEYIITEIQLTPYDEVQEKEFKELAGKNITVSGYAFIGETAWYIRDFAMYDITIE